MSDLVFVGLGVVLFVVIVAYARLCAVFDRSRPMLEPLVGLIVAALLGVYLVYTLLHPEDF